MATNLSSGDIAITGFNFDNPDELGFVVLEDIVTGTEINFTDDGVNSNGSFRGNEGTFTWVADRNYVTGELVSTQTSGIALSSSGDQIIAYQGTESNPTFLYAVNSEGSGWQSNATSANTSALPPSLIDGETAIALSEVDNAVYNGTTSGTKAELLTEISDTNNWVGSNSNRQIMPNGSMTVTDAGSGSGTSGGSGSGGSTSSVHLTFGNPSGAVVDPLVSDNYLHIRDQYAMSYNDTNRVPNWVAWQLNDSWRGNAARQNDFRPDNELPSSFFKVDQYDYSGSGFDRGHVTPSADRTATVTDNSNTFFMTNMIPQAPNNNRGVWASFENHLRTITTGKDLYIYAGGYGQGGDGSNGYRTLIGPNILVPANTWKTVLVVDQGETPDLVSSDDYVITIDIPNSQSVSGTSWQDWVISVDEVETATGFDFFSELPDGIEATLEAAGSSSGGSSGSAGSSGVAFINEIHYDNNGGDVSEGVEIAGEAGVDLNGWSLEFYNGNGGTVYQTANLTGTITNQDDGYGTEFFDISGIQNGAPDAIALVDDSNQVVQFLSYEGTLTGVGGAANGLTSIDIGVSETSSTPVGTSLQLVGMGNSYDDFSWTTGVSSSYGLVNAGQNFV
ncbi:MAG: DNA/RNA non-specific endonuclease [Microcoleaceae cyanobacterium MO_207.B10]|nr:DNA/RNA non-specific endonuclease [Microcoleaceae cyanobacterium MO_207.B10]